MRTNTRSGGGGRKMRGVVVGIVSNINDPDQSGRVKVRLPWLDDQGGSPIETHWARVTGFYAGASRGAMFIPELGDEVMVAFGHGDPNHPYVIGAVWNGEHKVPGPGNTDGKNDHKWLRSRAGHDFEFLDSDGGEKIRLVDSSTNNSIIIDTPADTITTEAKTGKINIQAPKGHIQIDCVDLKMTTTEGRNLEVGTSHTIKVGQKRTTNVSAGNLIQTAGSATTVTTASFKASAGSAVGVQAGAAVVNQGSISTKVDGWSEVQQGPVTRTVGSQKLTADAFLTVNSEGTPSGPLTVLAGNLTTQADAAMLANGKLVTIMGGLINAKGAGMVVAKGTDGAKAALSTWLGGLLLLNPNTLTFPATKLLDPIIGLDFHTTLPSITVPPLPPLPFFPSPFMGPILIDFKPTVLINFRPAAGSGATAISFHMPPLPWPWPPISHRPMITAAVMALMTAPFTALLEMGRAKVQALAAGSNNETLKRGFVADLLGSSHVTPAPSEDTAAGDAMQVGSGDTGTFAFTRIFPMFGSAQAFIGFLAGLIPLPVANASVNIASPTTTVCDAPLGMMIPMGANSCSDIPIMPNAAVVGFSNVLTGMSIGDFLGQLAWNAIKGAATMGFQGAIKKGANATARAIAKSNNPRLQNAAQRVNNFVGGDNCIAEGHPVDVVSGTLFSRQTDVQTHGAQAFTFDRFYNSRTVAPEGHLAADPQDLGPGWRHSLDEWLIADETTDGIRTLAYRNHEGRILGFDMPLADGDEDFHPLDRLTLRRIDGRTYEIRSLDGTIRRFEFAGKTPGKVTPPTYQPGIGNRAPLAALIEPMGGEGIRPRWQDNRLIGITDPCDREITTTHDKQGRLTTLRMTRSTEGDCDIFLAAYEYDGTGRLARHIDANRNTRRFAYDTRGRLIRETDRNGYAFHFRYDDDDRCIVTHGDDNAFWVELAYLPGAPVTEARDALGGLTRYKHDPDLKLVTETHDAEGGIQQTTYTPEGWVATEVDPVGGTWTHAYDDRGRRVGVETPDGHRAEMTYDEAGRLVSFTDIGGGEWRLERDEEGHISARIAPDDTIERFARDPAGRMIALHSPADDLWERTWSATGLIASDAFPDGRRHLYRYDALGRLNAVTERGTDGRTRQITIKRDAEGRQIAVERADDTEERRTLDPEGNPIEIRQGRRTTRMSYGPLGSLREVIDPLGRATRYARDLHHHITSIALPGNRSWRFDRDRLGRLRAVHRPDGRATRFVLDAGGRPIEEHRADARVVHRKFDAMGRVVGIDWSTVGSAFAFEYDAFGRLLAATGPDAVPVQRRFDPRGGLTTEVVGEQALRYRRDHQGRVVRRRASWGGEVSFEYNGVGNLSTLGDPRGGRHRFGHDGFGRRASWQQPGGVRRVTDRDRAGHIIAETLVAAGGDLLLRRAAEWRDTHIAVIAEGPVGRGQVTQFDHDDAGRLTGWNTVGERHAFGYDDADNLISLDGDAIEVDATSDRIRVDTAGRRHRYDALGRLVEVKGPEGIRRLVYDAFDRLVTVHTEDTRLVHYGYDALGRCVQVLAEQPDGSIEQRDLTWDGDHLARLTVGPAGGTPTRTEEYVIDPVQGIPLCRVVGEGEAARTEYFVTDERGAVTHLTDEAGRVLWAGRYDPYGRCVIEVAEVEQPLRLLGQIDDGATGLRLQRHRVFDPETARFITPDPIELEGGHNLYAWPSDPMSAGDPLGLAMCASRRDAFRRAKRDAGIPMGQQPTQVTHEMMTTRTGAPILDANNQIVNSREYHYTRADGQHIVIQEHAIGHYYGPNDRGNQGAHFNVRPGSNTRTGAVPGTDDHYSWGTEPMVPGGG